MGAGAVVPGNSRDVVAILALHEHVAAEVHEVERAQAHGSVFGRHGDAGGTAVGRMRCPLAFLPRRGFVAPAFLALASGVCPCYAFTL